MKINSLRLAGNLALKASKESRTISAIAYTSDIDFDAETDDGEIGKYRFAAEAVKPWREHVPVYVNHDSNQLVGRLSESKWVDPAWAVKLGVSPTSRGNDALADAAFGSYGGVSMHLRDIECADPDENGVSLITSALVDEISLVPHGAVETAVLTGVALSAPEPSSETTKILADALAETTAILLAKESKMPDVIEPVADTSASLAAPQPVPSVTAKSVTTPYPHLYGGAPNGNSWFADMEEARSNKHGSAAERLSLHGAYDRKRSMKLAVTTDNRPPTDPPVRDDLFYDVVPDPTNPLTGIVTTGTIPVDQQPMYVPYYDATDEANLVNPHVEGVEPELGDVGTFGRRLVEPSAVSGKVAATREASFNPITERTIWNAFARAQRKAVETDLSAFLGGLDLVAGQVKTLGGTNVDTELTAVMLDLLYDTDGDRYNVAIASKNLFGDIVNLVDSTGRPKFPILGATNANGTTASGLKYVNVNGTNIFPVAGMADGGYLLDASTVHVLLSDVKEWTFDYEVAWVRYGAYRTSMMFTTDSRGVIRLTRAA